MAKVYEGQLNAENKSFGIVVGRFNEFISKKLLDGAIDCLTRHGAKDDKIDVVWVPGSFEIPLIAAKLARSKKYDGIICLGVILRGDTTHNMYVSSEVAKGIASIQLETGIPIGYGVVNADSLEQAIERAGTKHGNRGWEAALSTIEMIQLLQTIH